VSYQKYKEKQRQESDRQAQLSYMELLKLNSKKAALMSLWQLALTYIFFTYILKSYLPEAFYMIWFVLSFSYETFGCKLRYFLRRL
jgi:hypothetical protein